jgi:hypothetical protein
MELRGAKTIIDDLKKHLKSRNKIKIDIQGDYAYKTNTKQTTFVIIKSNDRSDTLEVVTDALADIGVKYIEGRVTGSSFPGLTITDFKKFGKREKEIRILFKFPDGADSKSYNIWNELLDKHVFPKNSSLKRQPSNNYELNVLRLINSKIQESGNGKPIDIKIKNKTYKNIAGFVGGVGTKKADFVAIDYDGNEVCFISYKSGSTSLDFQQYGGITQRSGDIISNHPEVKKFNEDVVNNWESLSDDYTTLHRKISDRNLKKQSVFGKDYKKASGYDSVDFFIQGDPRFSVRGSVLHIMFSTKIVRKGDLSGLSRDYDPVLGARTGERYRKITYNGRTIYGVRGGIWTKGYIVSRRKNKEI